MVWVWRERENGTKLLSWSSFRLVSCKQVLFGLPVLKQPLEGLELPVCYGSLELFLRWRKILKLRDLMRPNIMFQIVDWSNNFLLHDNWHLESLLYLKHGYLMVYDAILSSVISNRTWNWLATRLGTIVRIQNSLPSVV